jgi:hypothetical protein
MCDHIDLHQSPFQWNLGRHRRMHRRRVAEAAPIRFGPCFVIADILKKYPAFQGLIRR